jgi:hypothetical protein
LAIADGMAAATIMDASNEAARVFGVIGVLAGIDV